MPTTTKEIEMKVKSLAANQTEITLNNGDMVFVSYDTPVAAFISGRGYLKSSTKHSTTTSRHVNKWTENRAKEMPQDFFDNLI